MGDGEGQQPASLYRQIADVLAAEIAEGVYAPGERVPSVRRLQAAHGVSATTAVEALRLLEARGVVESRPRSGTFVSSRQRSARGARPPLTRSSPPQRIRRADVGLSMRLNLGIGNPQTPTLGAAVQGPELMPIAALNRLISHTLRVQPVAAHSYDAPPGNPTLRRVIAQRALDAGYIVSPEEVVITNGAKEAVYLSLLAATQPGDTVAIESPAYYALLEVLASLGRKVLEVPSDPVSGIDLAALERHLGRTRVAALALVSNFSNPTGSLMTDSDKVALVELLERHRVPLVEDDVYGDLAFEGGRPKAIKAFDRGGSVLYCGSFSKTVAPGLRVGWAVPGRFQAEVEHLKLVVNQATSPGTQMAVAAFVEGGGFDRHIHRVRQRYAAQMAQMIETVDAHLPDDASHTWPRGGHVLWVRVPGLDSLALADAALAEGIHIAPGPMFSAGSGYLDHFRLNTGFVHSARTEHQVEVLGRLVRAQRARSARR